MDNFEIYLTICIIFLEIEENKTFQQQRGSRFQNGIW